MPLPLTISAVGRMFGLNLPKAPGKAKCPFKKHQRSDRTFRVFESQNGSAEVWKCWSCDPPENVGDAVSLYALLAKMDRKAAWLALRDMDFAVPGLEEGRRFGSGRATHAPPPAGIAKPKISLRGSEPNKILPLPKEMLVQWQSLDDRQVRDWFAARGFDAGFDFRNYGVIAMPRSCVGFVYVNPMSGQPCRVKVRSMTDKVFWNEPRPSAAMPGAKALNPLYLADRLAIGESDTIIITEGEMDALSLLSVGIENVISLPDGSESAGTVSIEPLCGMFQTWLIATDDDEPGERAWRTLRERARTAGSDPVRLKWSRLTGEDVQAFKDANDALRAGFTRAEYQTCIDMALRPSKMVA